MTTEPKFAPGTDLAIIFKISAFLPMGDPRTGDVKFAANVVKATAVAETETEYIVHLTGFTPSLMRARIRKEEVLIIGEASKLQAV